MDHAGLYHLSYADFLRLPRKFRFDAHNDASASCPTCGAEFLGDILAFGSVDLTDIQLWILCSVCGHTRRHE